MMEKYARRSSWTSKKKLPPFKGIYDEIASWHAEFYAPKLITDEIGQKLGLNGLDTRWHTNNKWPTPDWATIIHGQIIEANPTVEFSVLLQDFMIGHSEWSKTLSSKNLDGSTTTISIVPICYATPAGLVIRFTIDAERIKSISLNINYYTNHGIPSSMLSTETFYLER